MKRKRGVPKVAADNENAVIIVPQEVEKTPEPEDPAVVEWNAFAQDHYELVEQLPLSLHRSYSLMRELDELAQNNTALILPATRAYISLRDSLARKPKHKRVPSGLDLLAHVSASVEPPTVPNLAPDAQQTALEVVNGMLNESKVEDGEGGPTTSASAAEPPADSGSTKDDAQAPPDQVQNGVHEPVQGGAGEPSQAEPSFPQDSRKLLTLIATLASDAVRASSEKIGIANAVYHTVDNHLTALNALIAQHKATLPRPPTPTPPPVPPEPASPVPPASSPSLKIRTRRKQDEEQDEEEPQESPHETLPPLRLTRTGMTASNTTPTTIRIRGKPKPKPDEPSTSTRPRSVSMTKAGSASSVKSGGSTAKPTTPKHPTGGSGPRIAAPRGNKPPGKNHKKAVGVEGPEDEMDIDPNEPKYCHCHRVSFGEMIGCDGVDCRFEWFHLPCVGMDKAPPRDSEWFCPDCAKNGRKRRRKG